MDLDLITRKLVLRSSSYGNVMDNPEGKPTPILIGEINTAEVNNNPQDYVLVNGGAKGMKAAVRIKKSQLSPRPPLDSPREQFDANRLREELSKKTKDELREELIEAKWKLLSQEAEIKRLKANKVWGVADGPSNNNLGII